MIYNSAIALLCLCAIVQGFQRSQELITKIKTNMWMWDKAITIGLYILLDFWDDTIKNV